MRRPAASPGPKRRRPEALRFEVEELAVLVTKIDGDGQGEADEGEGQSRERGGGEDEQRAARERVGAELVSRPGGSDVTRTWPFCSRAP